MNKKVTPKTNGVYYYKNKPVIYIGPQDVKGFGFFYEKDNKETFFGARIKDLRPHKV